MLTRDMIKSFFIALLVLTIFTQGLIFWHNSSFEKQEYDRICNAIYGEKFWIDTCHVPYKTEIKTFETVRTAEIGGLILFFVLLNFKKFNLKN